ncbi:MAG: HAD-IA family hydrolase [Sedimenticola sp.]
MTETATFNGRVIRLVLFDLDGTFADTAPDLAYALNCTLQRHGHQELPFEEIRPHVSHGGIALIRAGFGITQDAPRFEEYRQDLLTVYRENISRETRLFPGMELVLDQLESQHLPWGIVTNKPDWLTDPLMEEMELSQRAACIVSGNTTGNSKPHPEPILYACRLVGCSPDECLYVGDAERDIEAGHRAGTATMTALFGYLDDGDRPEQWGADCEINHPTEILQQIGLSIPPLS